MKLVLQGSVGDGGDNHDADVRAVKARFKELGFDWLNDDGTVDDAVKKAIKLFQAIKNGQQAVNMPGNDGRIDVDGETHKWLNASNAPHWQKMPVGSPDAGYCNIEVTEELQDDHDYGTDWLGKAIADAAASYITNYVATHSSAAIITVNDASRPKGGDTSDHSGHETGLACDCRLPRTDGTTQAGTTVGPGFYDRAAMRAILKAFRTLPQFDHAFLNDDTLIGEGLCERRDDHDDHYHIQIHAPARSEAADPTFGFHRCVNQTIRNLAVYGPKQAGSTSTDETELYLLPDGYQTADNWDCVGIYVPTGEACVSEDGTVINGPVAIRINSYPISWIQMRNGKYVLPVQFEPFIAGQISWPIPSISIGEVANLPAAPNPFPAGQLIFGRCLNATEESLAVFGPKSQISAFDNQLYRLPAGRKTPSHWDCDGILIPTDRIGDQFVGADVTGPAAIKYVNGVQFAIKKQGTKYTLPPNQGAFHPTEVNWDIRSMTQSAVDTAGLPDVPNHTAIKPADEKVPGRCQNNTGETLVVYGPLRPATPEGDHNELFLLPSGRQTPLLWDCDGVYLPNDRAAVQRVGDDVSGPAAVKYIGGQIISIRKNPGNKYVLPFNFGVFKPTEHCSLSPLPDMLRRWPACLYWPIPDKSYDDAINNSGLPEVPNHIPFAFGETRSGIDRIDKLFFGEAGATPIVVGDPDTEAVGVIQDLLRGHGRKDLPGFRGAGYGSFGRKTKAALVDFANKTGVPINADKPEVGSALLRRLVQEPTTTARYSRAYITLNLKLPWDIWKKLLLLITEFESAGAFGRLNQNTDKAGLSYGLIQWAQSPLRLHEILAVLATKQPALFNSTFGGSTAAAGMLAHTNLANGGVDAAGLTTNPTYDLIVAPWTDRFISAGQKTVFQKLQIETALATYVAHHKRLVKDMPDIQSERGVAFTIDLGNQHGEGGALGIYKKVHDHSMDEPELLRLMTVESIRVVKVKYPNDPQGNESAEVISTRTRREFFSTSNLLSDERFEPD